ncbi:hypothetical protein ACWGBH_05650 [Streptomyces massasporeus]
MSERGPAAVAPVVVNALAKVPGSGCYRAVGATSASASSTALRHIER